MSDRCGTQKAFNDLFAEYRTSVIPEVISNWDQLSKEDQDKLTKINDFYCGLHFIVALADQSEACMKREQVMFDGAKVGSLAHGGYSKGDSGVLRLVRTVCKSVSERGCAKSGKIVTFATFLEEHYNMSQIPLKPFLRNQFNIIFFKWWWCV